MWLEQKYIGLVSNRLELFKRTKKNEYNFRCPLCGDSRKSKWKARGHLFVKDDGKYLFHCFNCSMTLGLDKFLQHIDPVIHQEYVREQLTEKLSPKERTKSEAEIFAMKMKPPKFLKKTPLEKLKKISQLKHDHPAKVYVQQRKIPPSMHHKLFYTPRFKEWVRSIDPELMRSNADFDEPRLIIPFIDEDGNLFGFQGRSFRKDGMRYITIMIDKSKPKIFGLDTCDRSKEHFILEGPIDSMFCPNAIAMAGGSLDMSMANEHSVFVFDNEPRSVETCKKIEKIIDKGYKTVIFPENITSKDINDMVLKGVNVESILRYNISYGLEAKVLFTAWRRV